MIRLSGFSEDDIKIEFTGLRPGEKLYEELLADGEATLPTPHPKLRIAKPSALPDDKWLAELEGLAGGVVARRGRGEGRAQALGAGISARNALKAATVSATVMSPTSSEGFCSTR
jgi:FlaA1/EpsC-like NDP-sugar epimerase